MAGIDVVPPAATRASAALSMYVVSIQRPAAGDQTQTAGLRAVDDPPTSWVSLPPTRCGPHRDRGETGERLQRTSTSASR